MILHVTLFLLAALFLARSSTFLVRELSSLSRDLRLSHFTVSFILMTIATALPDLLVGVSSAIDKQPILSLGNVIGSGIIKLTLIGGIGALVAKGAKVEARIAQKDIFFMNLAATTPIIMLWDGVLSRAEGAILIGLFAFYLYSLIIDQKEYSQKFNGLETNGTEATVHLARFITGAAIMVLAAEVLVRNASHLAIDLKLPLVLIGIFAVAFGTSTPELSFQIYSMAKKQAGMAFGNIIGSVVINSTLILGLTALIAPIAVSHTTAFVLSAFFLVGSLAIFTTFLRSERKLSWEEGLGLILLYAIFMIAEITVGKDL